MMAEVGFLSVNQSAAYGLLMETWKAREFGVPVLGELFERKRDDSRILLSDSDGKVMTEGRDIITINIERLWNRSSKNFKNTNL